MKYTKTFESYLLNEAKINLDDYKNLSDKELQSKVRKLSDKDVSFIKNGLLKDYKKENYYDNDNRYFQLRKQELDVIFSRHLFKIAGSGLKVNKSYNGYTYTVKKEAALKYYTTNVLATLTQKIVKKLMKMSKGKISRFKDAAMNLLDWEKINNDQIKITVKVNPKTWGYNETQEYIITLKPKK